MRYRWLPRSSDVERDEDIEQRHRELAAELARVDDAAISRDDLRAALAGLQPIWERLFPAERERILGLLVERVTHHPDGGDMEITLRCCGIQTLAAEARKAT